MREHLVGRTPRLTQYFVGIGVGLGFLGAGVEASRILRVPLAGLGYAVYAAIGVLGGVVCAFVAGYLNGSLVGSWAMGLLAAGGRLGPPLATGEYGALPGALLSALGIAVLVGTLGFAVAVVKHQRDVRRTDLPEPPTMAALVQLVGLSLVFAMLLLAGGAALG